MSIASVLHPRRPWPTSPWHAAGAAGRGAEAEGDERTLRRAEDARLAEGARGGDEEAFRRLVEKYQRQVYWIAYDVLLDPEEARDVAQETFIRVHAALDQFDASRDFLNWIYRIARNVAIDTLRRRRRRAVPVEDLSSVAEGADEESAADRATLGGEDLRRRVAAVLGGLPVEYRVALTLREFHGLSPREIAAITDCTYPTARWRLHRARALFRRAWEERFGAPAPEEGTR
jgi:RNA polymerase sigma-70 factor (ECF subfamily)